MTKKLFFSTVILFLLQFCVLPVTIMAQGWDWVKDGKTCANDAWGIATDPSGNIFCAGFNFSAGVDTFGTGAYTPPCSGAYQVAWVKYDNSGTALWAGGTAGPSYLNNICSDPSGNLIVFGSFTSPTLVIGTTTLTRSVAGANYFIAKFNPSGTLLWAINDGNIINSGFYASGMTSTPYSPYILGPGGVTTDNTGNIYITSSYSVTTMSIGGTTLTNAGPDSTYDIFLAKYSPSGTFLWASSTGGTKNDFGIGVTVASTGNVYLSGFTYSPLFAIGSSTVTDPYPHIPKALIAEYTSSGTPLWAQASGGSRGAFATGIASDNYGNVYITGGFGDTSISFGSTLVTRTYASQVPDPALFLVQYSPAGLVTWNKTIGSVNNGVWGYSIAMASCGQVWVSGNFFSPINIDDSILSAPPGGNGFPDPVFIAGYNLTGGLVGYSALGSGGDDQNGIACDGSGNVFICSDFLDSLIAGRDTLIDTSHFDYEYLYLAKYQNNISIPDTTFKSKDTGICLTGTDSVTLKAQSGYVNYYWNNGSTDSVQTFGDTGTYWVFCITCGKPVLADTFHITELITDSIYRHHDTILCYTGSLSITVLADSGFTKYFWNDSTTGASHTFIDTGTFWVYCFTCGQPMVIDTFYIKNSPTDTTYNSMDTSLCKNLSPITLSADAGFSSYTWNNGSTGITVSAGFSGAWFVYESGNCKLHIDTFNVLFRPLPLVDLGNDTGFCQGYTYTLFSIQPRGDTLLWNTGSRADSLQISISGVYKLTVTDSFGCKGSDSITVSVSPLPNVNLGGNLAICTGYTPLLQSLFTYPAGTSYLWSTGATSPTITAITIGTYWLQVNVGGCANSDTIIISSIFDTLNFAMKDTAICKGGIVTVVAGGTPGMTYQWIPTAGIGVSNVLDATIQPDTSALYYVTANMATCPPIIDSFYIDVQPNPYLYIGGNRKVCQGDTLHIQAEVTPAWYTHYSYDWYPTVSIDSTTPNEIVFKPGTNARIYLIVSTPAGCKYKDSAQIYVYPGDFAFLDTVISVCPGDSVQLKDSILPGIIATHVWHPGMYLNDSTSASPWTFPITNTKYTAIVTSQFGCLDTVAAEVEVEPAAVIYLGDSATLYPGESYQVNDQTNCTWFSWFPAAGLSNPNIPNPLASPATSTKYIVYGKTQWGCSATDSINIYVDPGSLLAIPNAFTPGQSVNPILLILKRGEAELHYFRIYDRWGNQVFESGNINSGWDGTYNGVPQPQGVYVYELEAVTNTGMEFKKHGNITLIR